MSSELSNAESIVVDVMEPTVPATSNEESTQRAANSNTNNHPWTDHEIQAFRDALKARWETEKCLEVGTRTPAGKLFPLLAQELKSGGINRNFESLKKRWYKKTRYEMEFQNTFDFSVHAIKNPIKNGDGSIIAAEDTDQAGQRTDDLQAVVAKISAEYFSAPETSRPRQPITPHPAAEASASGFAVWTDESNAALCKVLTTHWKIEKKLEKKSNGKELFTRVSEDLSKLGVFMTTNQCRKRWYRHLREQPEWKDTFNFSVISSLNNHAEKAATRPSSSSNREGSVSASADEGFKRFTYSDEQKRILTAEAKKSLFPSQMRRKALAAQLDLHIKKVSKWFATCRRGFHGFKAIDKQDDSQQNREASERTAGKRSRTYIATTSEFADSGCALNDSDDEYNGEAAPKRSRVNRLGESGQKSSNSTLPKFNSGKKTKQRFLEHELVYLVAQCNKSSKPTIEEKERIANHLGIDLRRVTQWFTNANYGFYGFGVPGSFMPYSAMYSSNQDPDTKDKIITPSEHRRTRRSVVSDDSDEDLPDPSLIINSGGRIRKPPLWPQHVSSMHQDAEAEDITKAPLSPQDNLDTAPSSARSPAALDETIAPKPRFFARKGPRVNPFDEAQSILRESTDSLTRPASELHPLRRESVSILQPKPSSEPDVADVQPIHLAASSPVGYMTSTISQLKTLTQEIGPLESSLLVTKMEIKEIDLKMQKLEQLKKKTEAKRIEVVTQLKDKKRKKESLESVLEAFKI